MALATSLVLLDAVRLCVFGLAFGVLSLRSYFYCCVLLIGKEINFPILHPSLRVLSGYTCFKNPKKIFWCILNRNRYAFLDALSLQFQRLR